jgi:hypothetical protein
MSNVQVTDFPALQASILHSPFFGDAVTEKSTPGQNPAMCRTFRGRCTFGAHLVHSTYPGRAY